MYPGFWDEYLGMPKTTSSWTLPRKGSGVGDKDHWWNRQEVFMRENISYHTRPM